jgi:integrase/recombinase XerC
VPESRSLVPIWKGLPADPKAAAPALLKAFLGGRKATTFKTYRQGLQSFADFIGQPTPEDASAVLLSQKPGAANKIALDFRNWLVERKRSAATVNTRLAALRSLVKMGKTFGLITWNLEVKNLKEEKYRNTAGPGLEKIIARIKELRAMGTPKALRDAAILGLMATMGLRRGEVVSLDLFDWEDGKLYVMGKGKTDEEPMTVPGPTGELLEAWVKARGDEKGPLFYHFGQGSMHKTRLSDRSVGRITNGYGLGHAHGLRHSAITEALDEHHGDVRKVARFSRHKNVQTLLKYDDNRRDLGGEVAGGLADRLK